MATPPFKYQPMFEKGKDTTEYYLLTKDYVSVSEFEGNPILKIEKEGLTAMANAAFRDVSFMLRRSHNEQVAKILSDPEASENDKYVAVTFLRNAEVASKGVLPFCQDTGTAIIHGEKGQQVWTGYSDEEALSLGVYKTYTEEKAELNAKIADLILQENSAKDAYQKINRLYEAIEKYDSITELTSEVLSDFVDRIEVGEHLKGTKEQKIDVFFVGVGLMDTL